MLLTSFYAASDSSGRRSASSALGFRPKNVTQEMVGLEPFMPGHYAESFLVGQPDTFHVSYYTTVCLCLSALFFILKNFTEIIFVMTCWGQGAWRSLRIKSWSVDILMWYVNISLISISCIQTYSLIASSSIFHCLFSHRSSPTSSASCSSRANDRFSTNPERESYISLQATRPSVIFHFLTRRWSCLRQSQLGSHVGEARG